MSTISWRACVKLACALFLMPLLTAGAKGNDNRGEKSPIGTTICELIEHPRRFENKIVRLRAFVESDLIEHTLLVDKSCESYGVSLWIPHEADDHPDFQELRNALKSQWKPDASKTRVGGVFTGTFLREGKKLFLKASKVDDIEGSRH